MLVESRDAVFETLEGGGGERAQRQGQAGHLQVWPGDSVRQDSVYQMTTHRASRFKGMKAGLPVSRI